MKLSSPLLLLFAFVRCASNLFAANTGDEVAVLYNTRVSESKGVADHYAQLRHVPPNQVFGLAMSDQEEISRNNFIETILNPLGRELANRELLRFGTQTIPATNGIPEHLAQKVTFAKIRYLVLCYGVPLRIAEDSSLAESMDTSIRPEFRRTEAAVDSELACLPVMDQHFQLVGPLTSRFYNCTNSTFLNPTNGILIVARLDGPTANIARHLVDKAIQAETDGLWGRAYFDLRGLTNGGYQIGDDLIHNAAEDCHHYGFETILDTNPGTFRDTFPMSQIAFYAGWYDEHVSGPFTRPTVEFMPGAFAYHLHSFSASTIRSTTRQWVGPLLAKGATITMGCVAEPYVSGTPDVGVFASRLLFSGFTFGEAACASQSVLSWQTTVFGDPLYRPTFHSPPELRADLERRHSPLLEWYYLRLVNLQILHGAPVDNICTLLENLDLSSHSAVLQEKLANLYLVQGKPSACIHAFQHALKLNPTPQQRVRLMLTLAERLTAAERYSEARDVYRRFPKDCPDYPDLASIRRRLDGLAQKVDKTVESPRPTNRVSTPPLNNPPPRRGI